MREDAFGALLRTWRRSAGYSLAGLAGLLGIPSSRLSAIERGSGTPLNPEQIARVAVLTERDPRFLNAAADRYFRDAFRAQWGMP